MTGHPVCPGSGLGSWRFLFSRYGGPKVKGEARSPDDHWHRDMLAAKACQDLMVGNDFR